jgi:hypothetical protein
MARPAAVDDSTSGGLLGVAATTNNAQEYH